MKIGISLHIGRITFPLLVLALAAPAFVAVAADKLPATSDFGYDIVEGNTNKIIRIASANPLWVWVIYDGGHGGRQIPRADLPPQLEALYPYDATKAAEFIRRQSEQQAVRDAAYRDYLQRLEANLVNQINALEEQIVRLQEDIRDLNRKLRLTPLNRVLILRRARLINQQNDLTHRINNLKDQLELIRPQLKNVR